MRKGPIGFFSGVMSAPWFAVPCFLEFLFGPGCASSPVTRPGGIDHNKRYRAQKEGDHFILEIEPDKESHVRIRSTVIETKRQCGCKGGKAYRCYKEQGGSVRSAFCAAESCNRLR